MEDARSTGPGPAILMDIGGKLGWDRGTRTAREWVFSAGLSTNAFPIVLRMNVYKNDAG